VSCAVSTGAPTADTFQLLRRDLYGEPYYYRLITNSMVLNKMVSPALFIRLERLTMFCRRK
jgi:hypothetical protein